jgi:ankyrin repeat protein
MNNKEHLEKLKQFQITEKNESVLYSHKNFLSWIDNVAPLLKYDTQHYNNFVKSARTASVRGLSSRAITYYLNIAKSIVNQAIIELENDITETKHTQQAKEKKPKLGRPMVTLLITIIGGLIVGAIIVFVFQPWQQRTRKNVKEDVAERDKILLQGQKPDASSSFQDRLSFMAAAEEGNVSAIESLLDKGVDVNTIDRDDNTALIWAAKYGQRACVQKLIEKGSKVDVKNSVGWTALITASRNGHKAVVELLIENGANVNAKANDGNTAFTFASAKGYDEIVDILKKSGAVSVKYQDPKILTAALKGDVNTLKTLLEKGVSPNTIDRIGGETPLMYAMGQNNFECAKFLLEFGADVNIRAKDGHTVLDDIESKPKMLELIEIYGTKRQ